MASCSDCDYDSCARDDDDWDVVWTGLVCGSETLRTSGTGNY